MPVKTSDALSSSQTLHLEAAVLSKTRGQAYYNTLQNWLEDQQDDDATPQKCSVEMMKKVITVLQKELECLHFQQARVMVLAVQHVAQFQDFSSGLPVLLSNGLVEILVYTFQVTQTHLSKCNHNSEEKNGADLLMETILETVNDIADYSSEGKQLTVLKFAEKLMDLIVDSRKVFQMRMEAQRTLNLLLENCPGNLTQTLTEKDVVKNLMKKMTEMLPSIGDFEMQVACTEALARLVTKSNRPKFASHWFAEDTFQSAFLAIQDLNFETDCRKFLNFVNDSCGSKRSVHSFPCKEAYLGSYKLQQPPDENLPDFWVDFNSASQSITIYVADAGNKDEDGSGMWETVTIKANHVKNYSLNMQTHGQKLHLDLSVPGKDILHFCPSSQKTASILFDANIDLTYALAGSLGDEKFQQSNAKSQKKASVCKVNVRVNRAEFNHVGHLGGHPFRSDMHHATESKLTNAKPVSSAHSTPNRPKVSVPIIPMRTPTLTSYTSSPSVASSVQNGYTSSGSKRNVSIQPKTPTKPHSSGTKKVKTPLQIVVADKQPLTTTTDTDSDAPPHIRSARKVSSAVATISMNSAQSKRDAGSTAAKESSASKVTHADIDTDSEKKKTTKESKSSKENNQKVVDKLSKSRRLSSRNTDMPPKSTASQLDTNLESETDNDDSQPSKTKGKRGRAQRAKASHNKEEGENMKGGRQTRSKKFKLYTTKQTMLMLEQDSQESSRRRSRRGKQEGSQEKGEDVAPKKKKFDRQQSKQDNSKTQKTSGRQRKKTTPESSQEDLVIPSSVPGTQDSVNTDIIPASLPCVPAHINSGVKRVDANVSINSSILHSPSLSTITEESSQSRKSNSKGKTPDLNERNAVHVGLERSPNVQSTRKTKPQSDINTSSTALQKNLNKKNATGVVNLKPKSQTDQELRLSAEITSVNKESKGNGHLQRARSRNTPPECLIVPESQLSQETQIQSKAYESKKKQERKTRKNQSTSKESTESKKNKNVEQILSEDNDPYKFTDTESIYSIGSKQGKGKKQTTSQKNNTQAPKGPSTGKTGRVKTQQSTQAFSPVLSQESPYQSQNDFRSPIELSGLKTSKQIAGKGKGDKKTGKNGKKSRAGTKGKRNKQENISQDDSLSDVEVMRDASAPKSSVRQKHSLTPQNVDEDVYLDEEICKFSDDLTKKLYKKKAELEKFLSTRTGRQTQASIDEKLFDDLTQKINKQKAELEKFLESSAGREAQASVSKEKPSRLKRSSNKLSAVESISEEENDKNHMTVGRKSHGESNGARESVDAAKSVESFSWRKKSAGNDVTKPHLFDSSLRKFPTRTGPIPTPDILEEESKKMKKRKTNDKSPKLPFEWDTKEGDGQIEKKKSKLEHKKGANFDSDSASVVEELQLGTEGFDVMGNGDGHFEYDSCEEELTYKEVAKNASRSNNCKKKSEEKIKQKKDLQLAQSESEVDDVSGHEELSDEENWNQEPTEKSRISSVHQLRKDTAQGNATMSTYVESDTVEESEREENSQIEEQEDIMQAKSEISVKGRQRKELSHSISRKTENDEDSEQEVYDSQEEKSRRKRTSKTNQQQTSRRRSGGNRKGSKTDQEIEHYQESDDSIKILKGRSKEKHEQLKIKTPQETLSTDEDMVLTDDGEEDLYSEEEVMNHQQSSKNKLVATKKNKTNKKIELQHEFDNSIKPQKGKRKARDHHPQKNEKKLKRCLSTDEDLITSDDGELPKTLYDEEVKDRPKAKSQKTNHSGKSSNKTKSHQHLGNSASRNKHKKGHQSSMFGSQIMDAESDEAADTQQNVGGEENREFDRETVTSVESFHNLCKKILQHSGGGIGATRSRRNLPKVNYKDPENSEIESSLSGSSNSTIQNVLFTSTPGSKTGKAKTPRSPREDPSPSTSKKRKFDDAQSTVSNRSWIVEKPKQKVTTYSKTRAQQWIGLGPPMNLDTVSAKKKPRARTGMTGGAVKQRAPPALPKKPKRPHVQSDEEEDGAYIYYYREEERATKVVMKDKPNTSRNRKTKNVGRSTRTVEKESDKDDDDEPDGLEIMRSQQSRHNVTPISSALLDYNTACDDIDLYPMTPVHDLEEMPLSQNSIAITPRKDDTPMSSRTPKLVTFEDDETTGQDEINDEVLVSGPARGPRPTKSALKRKYPDISDESDEDEDVIVEAEDIADIGKTSQNSEQLNQEVVNLSQGQGMLKPKNLFRTSFASALKRERENLALNDDDDNAAIAEEATSSDALSSWGSCNSDNAPMLQITQMMKIIGQNMKEKMRSKQNNAQQLTETTIKTAQKQVSKMWAGQHKARRIAQEDFQNRLLGEIVGLESDLSEMESCLHKNQALLQQHQRKVAATLMTHVKKLHKLETDYKKEGETLEVELGHHLVKNVKGLLRQGLVDMQKKMVQDAQHHEIQSMKRSLQSFIL